jgi:hypothetical protein
MVEYVYVKLGRVAGIYGFNILHHAVHQKSQTLHHRIVYTLCYTIDISIMCIERGATFMKLRPIPIVTTILISSALLFGGWFVYQNTMVKSPIEQVVQGIPGIINSEIQLDRNTLNLTLQLSDDAKLRPVYEEISKKSKSIAGNRTVTINLESKSSDQLDDWWSEALFSVAQAMETRQYGDIPKNLEQFANGTQGLTISTEIDAENVYVHLTEGTHHKYIILPRTPVELGVWPNESL